ncbi:hypothetical protein AMC99_01899 [Altererythrobacter epoxidivorans]|uniref:Uncharacterized protein n=1 Tax=Altererythrobacter epoxidivorans TaxID=361183 RepID=A0A0M5KYT3_9SPHN|nr:hypothetical protein [Altererythrobacter epoxidivorans]ALE17187.1 hypothetical protein AMC99_01899 [Altererythrobacter epoxidivorans]
MLKLLASTAALALAVTPALADTGNGKGNGKGNEAAQMKGQGQGQGNANRGGPDKAKNDANRGAQKSAKNDNRGNNGNAGNGNGNGNGNRAAKAVKAAGSNGPGNNGNRGNAPVFASKNGKSNGKANAVRGRDYRDEVDRYARDWNEGDYAGRYLRQAMESNRGLIDGCPPGLAKKNNGCLPPGQAKQRYTSYRPDYFGLRRLSGGNYYYNDGYLLRYGSGGLSGFIPLLGGALSIGQTWPDYYQPYELPRYYSQYYGLGGYDSYRYADNVIYRVDPETAAITSIAAMLTGDEFTVGRPMPSGYDVYNVPYAYRDRYYDTPQARYRYSDGYVYRIDPETALIAEAINLLI